MSKQKQPGFRRAVRILCKPLQKTEPVQQQATPLGNVRMFWRKAKAMGAIGKYMHFNRHIQRP
jgi:hypothetical protein